jgi:3',5'-nucleoside bisphosphate phosphatase
MSAPYCDFHLHSTCSDGKLTPEALVDRVADAGVAIAALTDHDTTEGCARARDRAAVRGVLFVCGIEMSTYAGGRVIHVLGLGIADEDPQIAEANRAALAVWHDNQMRWIESLEAEGFPVSRQDFADAPVRLPVLIERLCLRGIEGGDPRACHRRFHEFFRGLPRDAYARLPSPARAAALVRAAGGVSVLAHPHRLESAHVREIIGDLDAVEAEYAAYDARERAELRALAGAHGKLYSCGSDYHGYFTGEYVNPRSPAPPELCERLGIRLFGSAPSGT